MPLHVRLYTWANKLDDPTFEKLDRVLVSPDWDLSFPLGRDLSDHVPLLLSTGVDPPHINHFRYENCWVERKGFVEVVKQSWYAPTFCKFDVDKWQEKARRVRRHLKGWH